MMHDHSQNDIEITPGPVENLNIEVFRECAKELVVGIFISFVIHEINNKMGPILLYSELLQTNIETDSAKKHLKTIVQTTMEARGILNSLQSFVRKKQGEPRISDIRQNMNEVLDVLMFQFNKRDIEIDMDIDSGMPPIAMNTLEFDQIFFLMLLRIYHYIRTDGGEMKIRVKRKKDMAECTIEGIAVKVPDREIRKVSAMLNDTEYMRKISFLIPCCRELFKQCGGDLLIDQSNGHMVTMILPFTE